MKLFVLEEWIQKHCPKDVDFTAQKTENTGAFSWDNIMLNELSKIVGLVTSAYDEMKMKIVVKHAYSEMLTLKENYMISVGHKGNPAIMFKFIESLLVMLNPITPHFCQYQWQHVVLPRMKSCTGFDHPMPENVIDVRWSTLGNGQSDHKLSHFVKYLSDVKSDIRVKHIAAQKGGNKKGKGKQPAEKVNIENCTIFVSYAYPEYKMKVLSILNQMTFVDDEIQGDYIKAIGAEIKGKENGLAMKFCAHVLKQAKEHGRDSALAMSIPFDEAACLQGNQTFLFENMPTIKNVEVVNAQAEGVAEKYPGSDAVRSNAIRGEPAIHYW